VLILVIATRPPTPVLFRPPASPLAFGWSIDTETRRRVRVRDSIDGNKHEQNSDDDDHAHRYNPAALIDPTAAPVFASRTDNSEQDRPLAHQCCSREGHWE